DERVLQRVREVRDREEAPVPLGGEPEPPEADPLEAAVVEPVQDHHEDGEHQVEQHQARVHGEDEPRPAPSLRRTGWGLADDEGPARAHPDRRLGAPGRHQTYSSIWRAPRIRAYATIPIRSPAMRMKESAAAVG